MASPGLNRNSWIPPDVRPGTYGNTSWTHRIGGYMFTRTQHSVGLHLKPHSHDLASVNCVLDGLYEERFVGGKGPYEAGSFVFKPPGETHSNRFAASGATCLLVEIAPAQYDELRALSPALERTIVNRFPLQKRLVSRIIFELACTDTASALMVQGLMLELLAEATRAAGRRAGSTRPIWLDRVVELLHARFHDSLTIAEIAEAVGVNATHLVRSFKRHQHETIGDYIRRLRVEYVAIKLMNSTTALSSIAADAGFADQSHFSRIFKAFTGIAPSSYRAAHRSRAAGSNTRKSF